MIEATPRRPYTGYANDLLRVERNMRLRRGWLLNKNEVAPTIVVFLPLGALEDDGTVPRTAVDGPKIESEYIGDGVISPHPRFSTLTANIRQRRGEKVNIRVPFFRDVKTPAYISYRQIERADGCCGDNLEVCPEFS